MHIYCRTSKAVLLLGVSDDRGVRHFPWESDTKLPGIALDVRPLEPINDQLLAKASSLVEPASMTELDVIQNFSDQMEESGEAFTVYFATCKAPVTAIRSEYLTLPDLIRQTPQGRGRVILIKAMQVFSGALTQETKAVDLEEAIRHFDKD